MKNRIHKIAILLTPHTPGLKIFLLVTSFIVSVNITNAQSLFFDPKSGVTIRKISPENESPDNTVVLRDMSTYEESLKSYYSKKWKADRKEFQTVHKKKWWYYLPSVGWAFGLPTVSFGTSTLARIDRDKVTMKAKLDGIDARANYEYNEALLQLRTMYRLLILEMEQYTFESEAMKPLNRGIIKIHDDAFNDEKMKPLEHLQKSLEHQRFVSDMDAKHKALARKWLELEQFARYKFPDESLDDESANSSVAFK